jgi:hypothetical protein
MPVPTTHNRHEYNCDGSQTVFPFTFKIFKEEDLTVLHRDSSGSETTLTLTTNYTVSKAGADWSSGGNVTTVSTYPSGDKIILLRELDTKQSADFVYGDKLPSSKLEDAVDKRAMVEQQIIEKLQRALLLLKSSSYKDLTLPDPVADKILAWKSDLSGLKNVSLLSQGTLVVSTFIETLLDDVDAATARATLDALQDADEVISLNHLKGDASYKTAQTRYFSYFGLMISDDVADPNSWWDQADTYWSTGSLTTSNIGKAAINLPHGAVVTGLSAYIKYAGVDGHNFSLKLRRAELDGAGLVDLAEVTHTIQASSFTKLEDTTIDNAAIDNSLYCYYLVMQELDTSRTNHVQVAGIQITYTITEPKP